MHTYDRRVFGARAREIRRPIRRSSPALIYSGPLGIVIIAPLRNGTRWRIGKIMDRMAMVSRGDLLAGRYIHKIAAAEAYGIAGQVSRGDVLGEEPALAIASALQQRNDRFALGPGLPVEACFVQLGATRDQDYLAYISVEGTLQQFHTAWFMGEISDGTERTSSTREAEQLIEFNDKLAASIDSYDTIAQLSVVLSDERLPACVRELATAPRRDIVVLDRTQFSAGQYKQVFHRLTP
jgi:hypothetical protein